MYLVSRDKDRTIREVSTITTDYDYNNLLLFLFLFLVMDSLIQFSICSFRLIVILVFILERKEGFGEKSILKNESLK